MSSSKEMADEYYQRGMNRFYSYSLSSALDNFKMAESIYEAIEEPQMYVTTLSHIATLYSMLGYISPMLNYVMKGLLYCDSHSIKGAKSLFYTTMCDKYMSLKDYDNAINYGLLAIHDIESNIGEFPASSSSILAAYLNITLCYIKTLRKTEAKMYLFKAKTFAEKNNVKSHYLSVSVLEAYYEFSVGNDQFIEDRIDSYLNFVKDINLTVEDFIQDIRLLVELFCKMKKYNEAIEVTKILDYSGKSNKNAKLMLETAKLEMYIYKQSGNIENYNRACVNYVETDMHLHEKEVESELLSMDTEIALTIAATPESLI